MLLFSDFFLNPLLYVVMFNSKISNVRKRTICVQASFVFCTSQSSNTFLLLASVAHFSHCGSECIGCVGVPVFTLHEARQRYQALMNCS